MVPQPDAPEAAATEETTVTGSPGTGRSLLAAFGDDESGRPIASDRRARRRPPPPRSMSNRVPRAGRQVAGAVVRGVAAVATHWVARDIVAVATLWAIVWQVVGPALEAGRIVVENDTRVFYYPIFSILGDAWRTGRLPLWSPDLLTGYPLFADGEAGVLYPIHLLSLLLLPVDEAFAWQRVIRHLQGAAFMYAFVRAIGTGHVGAIVGGLAFGLGGFAVAQTHHVNIATGATWLPLALCFAELAVRRHGRARWSFALLAAVPLGVQGLIVHVQILLMSATTFVAYVAYRMVVGPVGEAPPEGNERSSLVDAVLRPWERIVWRAATLPITVTIAAVRRAMVGAGIIALAGGIGGALAAVQLVPLFELGTFSFRGGGVDYAFATQYQLPVSHFLTFLLPDAFMVASWPEDARRYWGLWSRWEIFGYVGLATLCLAGFGLPFGRSRVRWFFGALTVVALGLAVGEHSPFDAHRTISVLPGFSALRAPGRFAFLSTVGLAVLAGLGMDALRREWVRDTSPDGTGGWRTTTRRLGIGLVLGTAQVVAVVGPSALAYFSAYATHYKDEAMAFLQRHFVIMRGFDTRLNIEQLYQFALAAIDLAQPAVARQVGLLVAVVIVLTLWDRLRTGAIIWQAALVGLLAFDLGTIARTFHPTQSMAQLRDPGALGRFLSTQPGMNAASGAAFRAYTQTATRDEPNRLLLAGVSQANGYSSLQPERHTRYVAAAWFAPNRLLDAMGVRYFATPTSYPALPSFNLTSYDDDRPLFSSTSRNGGARQVVDLSGTSGDSIRIVSTMRWANGVAQGQPVARLTVVSAAGVKRELTLQAGIHTAAWDWERPELAGKQTHQMPPAPLHARTWRELDVRSRPPGQTFPAHFYYAEFPLGDVTPLDRLEIAFLHPTAEVEIFGLAVFNDTTKDLEQADISRNARFRRVYADAEAVLYENPGAIPRAYLVPSIATMEAGDEALQRMARGDWAPERMAIVEVDGSDPAMAAGVAAMSGRLGPPAPATDPVVAVTYDPFQRRSSAGPGMVTYTRLDPESVVLDVEAARPAFLVLSDLYYPGWHSTVDGRDVTTYRANYLFRGIEVPAGKHRVELAYRPRSFRLGVAITVMGSIALVGGLLMAGLVALVHRRVRQRTTIVVADVDPEVVGTDPVQAGAPDGGGA